MTTPATREEVVEERPGWRKSPWWYGLYDIVRPVPNAGADWRGLRINGVPHEIHAHDLTDEQADAALRDLAASPYKKEPTG